jgi:hypothetical protein
MNQNQSPLHDDCSGPVFEPVAKPFYGFRAFQIDDEGAAPDPSVMTTGGVVTGRMVGGLRGIFKTTYRWGPGENHAVCLRPDTNLPSVAMRFPHTATIPAHDSILADCDCGFWAYTSGEHLLSVTGPAALGVIEAWGRMIIGPYGFRAEKARIVGLVFPKWPLDDEVDPYAEVPDRQQTTVAMTPLQLSVQRLTRALQIAARALGNLPNQPSPPPAPVAVGRGKPWEMVPDSLKLAVRTLYPHARVCGSVAELQEKFPLSDTSELVGDA